MSQTFPGERPKWKVIDILVIILSVILAGMVSKKILVLINDAFSKFLFATIIQALILILGAFLLTKLRGNDLKELGLNLKSFVPNLFKGIVGGLSLLFIIIVAGGIVQTIYPQAPPPQDFENIVRSAKGNYQLFIIFFAGSILAPLSEEIFFRGFTYPVFRARYGVWPALIISGVFFGSLHFDFFRFLPLSLGGIALAWMYEKTGSLTTPMVAHAVWNFIMTLIIVSSS